ncbi:MAG TPA: ABC transporter ATP-binding protein [Caldisericia bacterium]|nr:ABC transporter ATP-binding protein [Caldisericia bacterium]
MQKNRLECKHLGKSFSCRGEKIEVLKDIQLEVEPQQIVIISGRSGEGKSSLLWLLAGIDSPDAGDILFEGQNLNTLSPAKKTKLRQKNIGLVFQNFNLIPSWTALENVVSVLIDSPVKPKDRYLKAKELLNHMNMAKQLNNFPSELSIGQQQRVALARALINDPILILADEPTGNVDDETATYLIDILHDHVDRKKASLIIATHGSYHGTRHDKYFTLKDGILFNKS